MRISLEMDIPAADRVTCTPDTLTVYLADGRSIAAPLIWYPRLLHGSQAERDNWEIIGRGDGIHWGDLDEDLSVEGLLAGRPSREGKGSFKKWLAQRAP